MLFKLLILSLLLTPLEAPANNTVEKRVMQLTKNKLDSLYKGDNFRYKLVLKRLPGSLESLSPDNIRFVEFTSRGWPKGYENLDVHYKSDLGKRIGKAQVKITVWQQLPVLKTRINAGDYFSKDLFDFQWLDITRLAGQFLTEPNEAIGFVSARLLDVGDPVRKSDLKKKPVLEAGNSVTMIYYKNGFKVEIPCVTRQAAAKGEEIRVFNSDTRKTYLVLVVDKNNVKWLRTL